MLKSLGNDLQSEVKKMPEHLMEIEALRTVMEGEDTAEITEKSNQLAQSSMKRGEAMYKATQEEEAASSSDGDEKSDDTSEDDEVVDADFEEVDEQDQDQDQDQKTGT